MIASDVDTTEPNMPTILPRKARAGVMGPNARAPVTPRMMSPRPPATLVQREGKEKRPHCLDDTRREMERRLLAVVRQPGDALFDGCYSIPIAVAHFFEGLCLGVLQLCRRGVIL
jgi:hypothetical protein